MEKTLSNKWIIVFMISVVVIAIIIGSLVTTKYPGITKKFLPAQATIIASQKVLIRVPKELPRWVMKHKAYFTANEQGHFFNFISEIGSYNVNDTIDVFYDPKRTRTVLVYSIPQKALILAEDGEYNNIYLDYDDVKAFFDSIHMHSKRVTKKK